MMISGEINRQRLVSFFLRIGLAAVFIYAATASLLNPDTWASFIPSFAAEILPVKILLAAFSVYELLLAGVLLLDRFVFPAAILSTLTMAAILATNAAGMDVLFRDVAIMFMALALAALKK